MCRNNINKLGNNSSLLLLFYTASKDLKELIIGNKFKENTDDKTPCNIICNNVFKNIQLKNNNKDNGKNEENYEFYKKINDKSISDVKESVIKPKTNINIANSINFQPKGGFQLGIETVFGILNLEGIKGNKYTENWENKQLTDFDAIALTCNLQRKDM